MAGISTSIELQDHFSSVLNNVCNAVNLAISSMTDMQSTMAADVDTSSLESAREQIDMATLAINEMNEAMQNTGAPQIEPPPVPAPTTESAPTQTPAPSPIPVQWQTDSLPVFDSSGIERFRQEVQSTDAMLQQLSTTQNAISRQAYNTQIFSPEMAQDMTNMAVRIDHVRERIQQIENNPVNLGTDAANAELEQLRAQLNWAVQEQELMNRAVEDMDVQAANESYLRLSQIIGNTERYIRDNVDEQGRFNQIIQEGTGRAQNFVQTLMGLSVIQGMVGMIRNQIGSAIERMDTMTNFSRTMTAITGSSDLANASLQTLKETTKGTAYGLDTAAAAVQNFTTRGMNIGSATAEVGKWADAVAFYGDGTNETLTTVTDAIGKMLTKGTVEMDQLNRLTDAGINAVGIYAQATGNATADVQKNLSKGVISANDFITTVSTAFEEGTNGVLNIAGAAKEAGGTWATSIANAKAAVTRGIISMIDSINQSLTNAGFGTILDGITQFGATAETVLGNMGTAVGIVITIMSPLLQLIAEVPQFVSDNWSIIAPVIGGIVAALAIYIAYLGIAKTIEAVSTAIKMGMVIAEYAHAAATGAAVAATTAETAAQMGLNTALLACPVTWIVLAVIALIAILYAAVAAVNKFAGTSVSATGIICGVFMVAAAFVGNLFVTLINFVIDIFVTLWNFIAVFANFFGNVFNDPVGAIARLFFDLADVVLGILESLASAIDTIFGSSLAGAVSGWRNNLGSWVDSTFGQGTEVMAKMDAGSLHLGRFEYGSAYNAGYNFGQGIDNKISNFLSPNTSGTAGSSNAYSGDDTAAQAANTAANTGKTAANTGQTADNTAKIADALDISNQELKYLRDIAERKVVDRYATTNIKVEMTNHNNMSSDTDIDGFVNGLALAVSDAMAKSVKGVHI